MQRKAILYASHLSYELATPPRLLFQNLNIAIHEGDRIGLVGRNGIGKSTLLKLLSGQLIPQTGTLSKTGSIYYLPQLPPLHQSASQDSVLTWLSSQTEEWWTVTALLEEQFVTELCLSQAIGTLSGGEWIKLRLAIALSQQPDILLLDEPTNHLDLFTLEQLRIVLQGFPGAFILVSHKPFFLDRVVETIWELTPEEIKVYGGNYSFYQTQKETEYQVALRTHEVARKELKRAKASAMQEQQRAAQSRKQGRKMADSMPKIVAGAMKRKAEVTAGVAKQKHEKALETATQKVTETKLRTTKATQIQLEERSQKRRNLIDIQNANLRIGDRILIENIRLHVSSGDRISIAGANGSGKSCLAKAIFSLDRSPAILESGEISLAYDLQVVYLDQNYGVVKRDRSILENMRAANPDLDYQLLRQQLGHFLFFNDQVDRLASVLSGGELARLAIAMISIAKIDLLILDEPTNNLDLETIHHIVQGVNAFQGALWVISHDIDFLSRIAIAEAYKLSHAQFQPLAYRPEERESYYQELLEI